MLSGHNPFYTAELKTRLERECAAKAAELGQGMVTDYAGYREGVGLIAGLRLAAEIADEIVREQERG